ncbi:MAG: hypothetical protein HY856_19355 [Burkholderiales bacterium]|nr:hypothetical protein [Burkholderiales bacterium]
MHREGDTVLLHGDITLAAAQQFAAATAEPGVRLVRLRSPGGDVGAALDIGERMVAQGMDVEVVGPCFSSCANYLFIAGRRKVIRPGAVVGWHGNVRHLLLLQQQGEAPVSHGALPGARALAERERRFFTALGVDESVCWIGKMPPYRVFNLYFLPVEAMARFGIHGISAPADYAQLDTGFMRSWRGRELVLLDLDAAPALDSAERWYR